MNVVWLNSNVVRVILLILGAVIMNIHRIIPVLILTAGLLMLLSSGFAQTGGGYDLSWNTWDGGGGTSIGGSYEISGTIGQPDAGVMSGGSYTLSGGFWPGATPSVPRRMIWFLY